MSSLLDDRSQISAIDRSNMIGLVERFPEMCLDALSIGRSLVLPKKVLLGSRNPIRFQRPSQTIVVGMGGSAIGGDLLKDWLENRISMPIQVKRGYHLPAYAGSDSLVVAVSYSGNTEETLSTYVEAVERGCMTFSISSGGLLEEFSHKLGLPHLKLPGGYPPRSALPYLFFPIAACLEKLGVFAIDEGEVAEAIEVIKAVREMVRLSTPTQNNPAKQLALSIKGTIPMVCGFSPFEAVASRFKTQLNENSKTPAKAEFFSELNHNETAGWSGARELTKCFSVVLIRSEDEPPEVKARIEVTRKLVFNQCAQKVLEIHTMGNGRLAKMLSAIYIGDFASVYLGILYGFDPTPIPVIDELKKELEKRLNKTAELKRRVEELAGG